ncbi:hypothetical protein NPIL_126791 [Nephila pilipes]|uniref:Uncharacterized protein n=1 Tax=Nephila pilipes TaxID=299642 RepID=A0A8X6UVR5_NEPPI|nr:hypothetical protein NPIL_126791 [Nephila pilipes]
MTAEDCSITPCQASKHCISVQGTLNCVDGAILDKACSAEPGRGGVYDRLPPCVSGLICDTTKTIVRSL